jgi:hypothetical protein
VNQEDYGATLLVFSLVFSRGMQRLGVPLTQQELDSIHHGWRYAGYVMGVDPRLLTASLEEEHALYATLIRRHGPDQDSRALLRALFAAMAWQPPFMVPEPVLHATCWLLLREDLAVALGVPRAPLWRAVPRTIGVLSQSLHALYGRMPGGRWLAEQLGTRVVSTIVEQGLSRSRGQHG